MSVLPLKGGFTIDYGTPNVIDGTVRFDGVLVDLSTPDGIQTGHNAMMLLQQFGQGLIAAATGPNGSVVSTSGATTAAALQAVVNGMPTQYDTAPQNYDETGNPAYGREQLLLGFQNVLHQIAIANPGAVATTPPPGGAPGGGLLSQSNLPLVLGGLALLWLLTRK